MIQWLQLRGRASNTTYLAINITESDGYRQVALRFSKQAQEDLRFIHGDRLVIGFDKTTKQVCFKRTSTNDGHKLTGSASGNVLRLQASVKNMSLVKTVFFQKEQILNEVTHYAIHAPMFFDNLESTK